MIIQSKALVIKSFPYGETSLISRVLLESGHKLSIMIKGAKAQGINQPWIDYLEALREEIIVGN